MADKDKTMTTTPPTTATTEKTIAKPPTTAREWINHSGFQSQIAKALPKHITADRMARVVLTLFARVPKLEECTVPSILNGVLVCAQAGLEPDGRLAHLIPFMNKGVLEAQVIFDYKGLVQLMYQSGFVKRVHAAVVYEGDLFTYEMGEVKQHVEWEWRTDKDKPASRGKKRGAWAMFDMTGGVSKFEVMTASEIKGIQARSKAGSRGPWVTDEDEMWKKTVIRRGSKLVPLSAEVREQINADDDRLDIMEEEFARKRVAVIDAPLLAIPVAPPREPGDEGDEPLDGDVPFDAHP